MHISHVAGNLSHANEESQPRHVITLLISTQASSGKVRREELKNFSFHSLFFVSNWGHRLQMEETPAILCPGFKTLPKGTRNTALDLVFLGQIHPPRTGRASAAG